MAMDHDFPTDVLVEILLRLPPSSRRRCRLVCRHWRDLITDHTTEMRSRAIALLWNAWRGIAYVVDDVSTSATGICRGVWRRDGTVGNADLVRSFKGPYLAGTCNGLLCLCMNGGRPGGAVTLLNPATGGEPPLPVPPLPVPPLPCAGPLVVDHCWVRWDRAYSFAYHPTTGRHMVVHVPCRFDTVCEFDAVQVFTLGDVAASWRDVPAPAAGGGRPTTRYCDLDAGVVSIDGVTHWVTEGAAATTRVVSLDLENERITSSAMPLRALSAAGDAHRSLAEVRGKLGVVIEIWRKTAEVWVMEDDRRWSHRYSIERPASLTGPHFAHGDYVLTCDMSSLYGHRRPSTSGSGGDVAVQKVGGGDEGTVLCQFWCVASQFRIFSYVETTEPLSIYKPKNS